MLLLVLGCGDAIERMEPPEAVAPHDAVEAATPIQTDARRYRFTGGPYGPQVVIVTTFTAPPDQAVYLVNCNGAITTGLQRKEGERWIDAWIAMTNACLSQPIVVPAGTSRSERIVAISEDHAPFGPGTYRAVWHNALTSFDAEARPFGPSLPLELRVSDPFVIE